MASRTVTEWTCDVCGKVESEKLSNWRNVASSPLPAPPPTTTEEMMAAQTAPPPESASAVTCSKACRTKWNAAL